MAVWPATLPLPLIEGYALQPLDNCSRSSMESGHLRVRMEFEGDKDFLSVNWMMTNEQLTAFRDWYRNDIADGADWFDAQLDYDGQGLKDVEARFAGKWTLRHEHPFRWRVTAKLEISYPALTALEEENILLGVMEKDVVLLWAPTTQDEVATSKIGPDPIYAYSGNQYNEAGQSVGLVPAFHADKGGVWAGPANQNQLPTGSENLETWTPAAATVAGDVITSTGANGYIYKNSASLPIGTYTFSVQIDEILSGNGACILAQHSGGTWAPKVVFTAPGRVSITFTTTAAGVIGCYIGGGNEFPTGESIRASKPILTNTKWPMPYVPPGTTAAYGAGGGTASIPLVNGLAWPMALEASGIELISNGGFASNYDGWAAARAAVLSVSSNGLTVAYGGTDYPQAYQAISTVVGGKYRFTAEKIAGVTVVAVFGTTVGGNQLGSVAKTDFGPFEYTFNATSAITYVMVQANAVGNVSITVDNVSVQRLVSDLFSCFESPAADGIEQFTNGDFSNGLTGWLQTAPSDWTVVAGAAKPGATGCFLYQTPTGLMGKTVRVRFRIVDNGTVGSLNLSLSNGGTTHSWIWSGIYDGMWVEIQGVVTLNDSIYFFPSSGWDGTIDDISVQVVPAVAMTAAVEVVMGVNATELIGDTTNRPLICPNNNINQAIAYRGDGTAASAVRVSTYDGTTWGSHPIGNWERYERHLKIMQVNAARTQYRSGHKRLGIDSVVQWGSWANFDGSFDAWTNLIAAYSVPHPIWISKVMVAKTPELTEKQILERINA